MPLTGDQNTQNPADFTTGMTGSCLCGAVSVALSQNGLFDKPNGHQCFCSSCRKRSGCDRSTNLATLRANVEIRDPQGVIRVFEDRNTGSGKPVVRHNCGVCSSPIYFLMPHISETMCVLPLGIFPRMPKPEFEAFAPHKLDWQPSVEGVKGWPMPGEK